MMKIALAWILICLFVAPPTLAAIAVNATDVGTTYILWEWTTGTVLDEMFIDGNQMCGYETTNTSFLLTDLNPSELHTITLINGTDTGTNSTYTLASNVTPSTGSGDSGESPAYLVLGVVGGLIIMARKGLGL